MRLASLSVLVLGLSACYTYSPVRAGNVAPGVSVRARVTSEAADRLAPLLGNTPRVLTGTVITHQRDTLVLEVPSVLQAEIGSSMQTLHQRVTLPRADIIEWEIRSLNRTRTYLLVGAIAVVAGATLIDKLQGEPGLDRLPPGGGTDALVPVFGRWR